MQLAKTLAALERLRAARRAVRLDPVRPDHRRRLRLVRGGRRRQHRRTRRADRLCRGPCHGRHDRGRAAGRVPAVGVPVQPRLRRSGRRPRRRCATELTHLLRLLPARGVGRPGTGRGRRRSGVPTAVVPVARSPIGSASWRRATAPAHCRDRRTGRPPAPAPAMAPDIGRRRRADQRRPRERRLDATRSGARVQLARNLQRPRTLEFVAAMADDFVELHGDRLFGDDEAMVAGLARIDGRRVVVIGQQKGDDTDENIRRNFGMPHPEGYRKAMRVMELAERFGLPVVTFVDVPGRASRPGVRGARHRRGDRPLDRADEPPAHADRGRHHRRGRLGRGAGHRGRRRGHRPRERGLLGHQPRGLCLDPVAHARTRRPARPPRCACRRPTSTPSASSTSSSRSPARAPTREPAETAKRLRRSSSTAWTR